MRYRLSLGRHCVVHGISIRFRSSIRSGTLRQPIELNPPLIYARVFTELTGDLERVDPGPLPPASLVAGVMHRAVMDAAERDREFIARLRSQVVLTTSVQ